MVTNPPVTTELIETGEKRDALGRRRTPRERRTELLAAYRASGLTQVAFARREGLRYSTFCTWAQAERRAGKLSVAPAGRSRRRRGVAVPAVRFVEACLPGPGKLPVCGLEVRLPDGTVMRSGSAVELAALVQALRG
ncbi:MAG: hypothetical protein PHE83_08865 [Opitutaceae bacterium]|nr:hypothetical protein [Opitutaceae bacterium]